MRVHWTVERTLTGKVVQMPLHLHDELPDVLAPVCILKAERDVQTARFGPYDEGVYLSARLCRDVHADSPCCRA